MATSEKQIDDSLLYGVLSKSQVGSNWDALMDRVQVDFAKFAQGYKDSTIRSDGIVLGFKDAPAGKGIHHAYRGGLVEHLLEGLDILDEFRQKYPTLDHVAMQYGWLLHDIHKAHFHYIQAFDGKINYLDHALTKMFSPNQKTFLMLSNNLETTKRFIGDLLVHNIIHCSEGGWAEHAPKEASVEAKLVYLVDELSVVKNRIELGKTISIYDRTASWFSTRT